MAFVKVTQQGASYQFGFQAANAPVISGMVPRSAELKFEPEVYEAATDGEGHADSVTLSLPVNRKITGTFTGYITDSWDPTSLPVNFAFEERNFIIKSISEPRQKGKYVEVSVETESLAGVTG